MIEETAGETPEVQETAQDAQVSESSPEQQPEAETKGEAAPTEQKGEPASVPEGVQKRIDELTRKRREAERRAEAAEKRLKAAEAKNLDDLDYDDQVAERTLRRTRADQIEMDREAAQGLAQEAFLARGEAFASQYPDYGTVVSDTSLQVTPLMTEAIIDSEHGPAVAYYLGKNPQEAARISQLNPVSQAREIGRIEAKLTSTRQTKQPASAPVNPVGARAATTTKDPAKMTMAEYVAYRKTQDG